MVLGGDGGNTGAGSDAIVSDGSEVADEAANVARTAARTAEYGGAAY